MGLYELFQSFSQAFELALEKIQNNPELIKLGTEKDHKPENYFNFRRKFYLALEGAAFDEAQKSQELFRFYLNHPHLRADVFDNCLRKFTQYIEQQEKQ